MIPAWRGLLWLCLLLAPGMALAGAVHSLSVDHKKDSYVVDLRVGIDAPLHAVYGVLTDYSRLKRINPAINYTHLLPTPSGQPPELKSRIHMCITFYCRDLIQTQKMYASPPDRVSAVIMPAKSDFKAGTAYWHLSRGQHGTTSLHFHADMTPDFWVPPLLGPWVIQRVLRSEAVRTARGLEKAARSGG